MTPTCTLKVTSGPVAGTSLEVEGELIIGRRDADLTIPDEELSRRHASLRAVEAGVVVEDLGSLNGTFVDGERISGPVTLAANATIRVGTSEMALEMPITAAAPTLEDDAEDTGRTRLAQTLPAREQQSQPPEAAEPNRVGAAPGAASEETPPGSAPDVAPREPVPIPQPQVTRVRPTVGSSPPEPPAQEPPATPPQEPPMPPQGTPPEPQNPPAPRAIPQSQEPPAPRAIPQPQVTRVRQVVPGGAPSRAEGARRAEGAGTAGGAAQSEPPGKIKRLLGGIFGRRRGGG